MVVAKNGAFARGIIECVRKIVQKNVLRSLEKLSRSKPPPKTESGGKSLDLKAGAAGNPWLLLKSRIHKALVEEMDLKTNDDDNDPKALLILREKTKKVVVELLNKEDTKNVVNGRDEMNQIVKEILDEALSLGPLEDLLNDKTVSEVMVNGPYMIYYEQSGKIKLSKVVFTNDRQVLNVIAVSYTHLTLPTTPYV